MTDEAKAVLKAASDGDGQVMMFEHMGRPSTTMLELSPEEALAWTSSETARRRREEDEDRRVDLLPPEAFSDEYAPAERLTRVRPRADPRATGPDSQTVRGLICGACAGWRNPPTSREFYEAMRAERLDDRQRSVVGVLINESTFEEMMNAHTEQAFTWRQLVRAMHQRGCVPAWRVQEVNRFAECGQGNGRETWRP